MKLLRKAISVICAITISSSFFVMPTFAETNIWPNGDMETKRSWYDRYARNNDAIFNDGSAENTTEKAHSGSKSMKIARVVGKEDTSNLILDSARIDNATKGDFYKLSGYVYTDSKTTGIQFLAENDSTWRNSYHVVESEEGYAITDSIYGKVQAVAPDTNGWTYVEDIMYAHSINTSRGSQVRYQAEALGGDVAYFDDFKAVKLTATVRENIPAEIEIPQDKAYTLPLDVSLTIDGKKVDGNGSDVVYTYVLEDAGDGVQITDGVLEVATDADGQTVTVVAKLQNREIYRESITMISELPVAPVAKDVRIDGVPIVGNEIEAYYKYSDGNKDPEDGTTFQWYINDVAIKDDNNPTYGKGKTYVVTAADIGKKITVGVTPKNANTEGGKDTGKEVKSEPVTALEAIPEIINVIYMIPDGGGYGPYDFANMVKKDGGFDEAKYPNKTPTDTEPMTMRSYLAGSMTTKSNNATVTDSAAAGTAMSTGKKTNNSYIGVDPSKKPVATLVEAAQSVGKATGLIATYEWMHATPAAFSAHAVDRNDYKNLYEQIENQGIEVVLGTGYGEVGSYATIQNAQDRGYTIIDNKSKLDEVKPGDKLWGNMADSMPYDINLSSTQATLAEMTEAAITALSGDEDGFFLMVERSKVDTGGHAHNAVITTSEYLAFDEAFKVALEFAKGRNDTVIIAAPDHDTGGMVTTSDMQTEVDQVQLGTNPSTITWTGNWSHTAQNVGVWMYVPEGIEVIEGLNSTLGDTIATRENYVIDNTDIAPYVADLFEVDMQELTNELFVDVTDIGSYANDRFTFYNGNKYVDVNQSVYYKDGQEISMDGEVAVYINNKFYVPSKIVEEADWNGKPGGLDGFAGTGTKTDPYIMANAYDFVEFTQNVLGGNNYSGKYFKQAADIDLAGSTMYAGMGSTPTFYGVYDGDGHTININFTSGSDECIFPSVYGTIMNLGTTGTIKRSGGYAGGIARALRAGGKIVNCYSNMSLTANDVGGIAWSNYGTISNCYFGGTISSTNRKNPIANAQSGSTYTNCYYVDNCGATQSVTGVTSITTDVATSKLAENLNSGRQAVATALGVGLTEVANWGQQNGSMPTFMEIVPTVTGVTVTPNKAEVKKGSSLQLTATVAGENNPSQEVVWSLEPKSECEGTYITDDGLLVIDKTEACESFTVMAKSKQNGSVSGIAKVTLRDVSATLKNVEVHATTISGDVEFDLCLKSCMAYVAIYNKSGRMLAVQSIPVSANTVSEDFILNYKLSTNEEYDLKLFLWNDKIAPLALAVSRRITAAE